MPKTLSRHEILLKLKGSEYRQEYRHGIAAIFPEIYLLKDNVRDMERNFSILDYVHTMDYKNRYSIAMNQLKSFSILASHEDIDYLDLLKYPFHNWKYNKSVLKVRYFLLTHAYYHYLHEQFFRHFFYIRKNFTLSPRAHISVLKMAALLAFYTKRNEKFISALYDELLEYDLDNVTLFKIHLQQAVLLTHLHEFDKAHAKYNVLADMFTSIENDRITVIDYYNAKALLHYKEKKYSQALDLLEKAKRKLSKHDTHDSAWMQNKRTIINRNIEKIQLKL